MRVHLSSRPAHNRPSCHRQSCSVGQHMDERAPGRRSGNWELVGSHPAAGSWHGRAVTRIAVVYYSATGNVHRLAHALADGARDDGAEVRLRQVEEIFPEQLISQNQYWGRHRSEVEDEPVASLADLEWADGIALGTPTRFGNVAAQLKFFLDLAGELWERGALVDKVATSFTSAMTEHGGQESTILALNNTLYHWGAIVLPLGYTVHEVFNGGGNPYGTSYTSDHRAGGPDEATLMVARAQGARLARVAGAIAAAREAGPLTEATARARSSNGKRN
jgi:NAD(P)H dehydrogenase (quinone)